MKIVKGSGFEMTSQIFTVLIENQDDPMISYTYTFEKLEEAERFVRIMRGQQYEYDVYNPVERPLISGNISNAVDDALDELGIEDECECITTDMSGRCTHCLSTPAERAEREGWSMTWDGEEE